MKKSYKDLFDAEKLAKEKWLVSYEALRDANDQINHSMEKKGFWSVDKDGFKFERKLSKSFDKDGFLKEHEVPESFYKISKTLLSAKVKEEFPKLYEQFNKEKEIFTVKEIK